MTSIIQFVSIARRERPDRVPTARLLAIAFALFTILAAPALGQSPESERLADATFRQGLLDLKLFHLLEYHLEHYPPKNERVVLGLRREIALAVHDDPLASAEQRAEALATANRLLAELIEKFPRDDSTVDWRLELAQALIYDQAEPYYSNIFYRGGTDSDRRQLAALMDRAVQVLRDLQQYVDAEYNRIDELSIAEYENLDETGYVLKIESAMPRTAYMLRWARFYRALAMEDHDPQRREILSAILQELTEDKYLLTEDHSRTHVQAQLLLLAGLVSRRLANYESAVRYLHDAAQVVDGIRDVQERRDLQWLVILASVERVRALRDSGDFEAAREALAALKNRQQRAGGGNFGHELTFAMLETSIIRARAAYARRTGNDRQARTLEAQALDPLAELAGKRPHNRDEIYAALYDQLRNAPNPDHLHPFERAAIVAGHIAEAARLRQMETSGNAEREQVEAEAVKLLDEAIEMGSNLLAEHGGIDQPMHCEVRYNVGVAQYNRGLRFDAADSFITVAKECRQMARAPEAAAYAVEIAAQFVNDASLRSRDDVRALYLESLRLLVQDYSDTEQAQYWRFFLAQELENQEQYEEAARVYSDVSSHQPNYLLARFRAVRCRVQSLAQFVAARPDELPEIARQAGDARRAVDRFKQTVAQRRADNVQADQDLPVEHLLAEADVLLGELNVLPGVDQPNDALAVLDGFEERFPDSQGLMGRVLRVRIVAYEAIGQLDKARQAVPQYVASAPAEAGGTLQSLFESTWREIEQYRRTGRDDLAQRKAASALMFAEQIHQWATTGPGRLEPAGMQLVRLQLAEANLEAGRDERALELFRQAVDYDAAQYDGVAHDPRAVLGLAKAYFALGRYADALPLYNRMFQELSGDEHLRFTALLGDLKSRTELNEPAQPIIDAIRQHRYLSPDMGGEELKQAFADLQARNEKRL